MVAKNVFRTLSIVAILSGSAACSKKTAPAATAPAAVEKKVVKKKPKGPAPKVIVVNDAAAKKTADGRLFYDLDGKRYWKNKRDGKYYLFNKAMYNNPDFQ